jgi:hypothetical protein
VVENWGAHEATADSVGKVPLFSSGLRLRRRDSCWPFPQSQIDGLHALFYGSGGVNASISWYFAMLPSGFVCELYTLMIATDSSMTFASSLAFCSLASWGGYDDLHVMPLAFLLSSPVFVYIDPSLFLSRSQDRSSSALCLYTWKLMRPGAWITDSDKQSISCLVWRSLVLCCIWETQHFSLTTVSSLYFALSIPWLFFFVCGVFNFAIGKQLFEEWGAF